MKGRKDDQDKARWDLLPWRPIGSIVAVITHGAKKYSSGNWKHVANAQDRYFSAALRHLTAWKQGEHLDPDSGLPHLAHAGCCLLFLHWFDDKLADARPPADKPVVNAHLNRIESTVKPLPFVHGELN